MRVVKSMVFGDYMVIFIALILGSFRELDFREVLIVKGSSSACPYVMLKRCMSLSNSELGADSYLFKPVNK